MNTNCTKHCLQRSKERLGANQKRAEKYISLALMRGKCAKDFSSWEKSFLQQKERDDCKAYVFNDFCYIVNNNGVCVTLYPLPTWFGKKKHFDGKEKIRNIKKYNNRYAVFDGEF